MIKALLCEEHGPPEMLRMADVPMPEPVAGEVRIRIAATGVNFPDALIVQNRYQVQPPLPFSPGGEVAGVIDAIGSGVEGWSVGDRVAAMTLHGGMAQAVTVAATRLIAVPSSMPLAVAAGFTMAYGTAIHALRQRGALQPDETLLVLGAAGGIGLAAVEIGRAMGAHVIGAASSPEKLAVARAHGAQDVIDYVQEPLRERIMMLTGGKGPDVIYDPVGGAMTEPAFRSIAPDGRHLVLGFAGGDIPALPFNLPLLKSASVVGVFWGAFTTRKPHQHRANMDQLFDWYEQGLLKPEIDRRYPLDQGGAAIRHLMDRRARGKVIVDIADID